MSRRDQSRTNDDPSPERGRGERDRAPELLDEIVDFETSGEPHAGAGPGESGTLPGSVGGTTGEAKRAAGQQAPGASAPPIPGVDPEEARDLVGKHRILEEEESEDLDEPESQP